MIILVFFLQVLTGTSSQSQGGHFPALRNFTATQKEKTLHELLHDQWLKDTPDGNIELGIRSFLDLRSWFRNNDVPSCEACNEAGVKVVLELFHPRDWTICLISYVGSSVPFFPRFFLKIYQQFAVSCWTYFHCHSLWFNWIIWNLLCCLLCCSKLIFQSCSLLSWRILSRIDRREEEYDSTKWILCWKNNRILELVILKLYYNANFY